MKMSNRQVALAEVIGFSVLAVGSKLALDPVTWRFSGPITLLFTLIVLAAYRRWRGQSWRDLGFRPLPGLKSKLLLLPQILLGVAAILGTGLAVAKLGDALAIPFMQHVADRVQERWGNLRGNLPLYLLWLSLAWVSAGFGEETFFRGFLIGRLGDALTGLRFGRALAVVVSALFFGVCHIYYQGLRGLFMAGSIGLVLGLLFLLYRRNLWPLVAAHALVDTLMFTAIFLNRDI
ncbi:MAG: type II CAAX endopeptidase family protein [Rudaea sp.]